MHTHQDNNKKKQQQTTTKDTAKLIDLEQDAKETGNKKLYHKLKRLITKEMKKLKKDYSLKIQHLAEEPAEARYYIKKFRGSPINKSARVRNDFKPDELNTFFTKSHT